jgi:hypothetical protein
MYRLGRLLQLLGLIILPLAMARQLFESYDEKLGQMLMFVGVGIGVFYLGYLLQRYSGGRGS